MIGVIFKGVQVIKSWSTTLLDGLCAKDQFEHCHQVALSYQVWSHIEDLYQSIGGINKWS